MPEHKNPQKQLKPMHLHFAHWLLCAFGSLREEMISDRLACGISDNGPRKKLLQEAELRLEKCMNYCRAAEAADIQLKEISSHGAEAVHHLNGSKMGRAMKECKYCSRKHERGMEKCPAYGKTCTKCSNQNHFRSVCLKTVTTPRKVQPQKDMQRSKPEVHAVHKDLQPSSEDELWVLAFAEQVNAFSSDKGRIYAAMEIWSILQSCPAATCLLMLKSRIQCENFLSTPSPK